MEVESAVTEGVTFRARLPRYAKPSPQSPDAGEPRTA